MQILLRLFMSLMLAVGILCFLTFVFTNNMTQLWIGGVLIVSYAVFTALNGKR